MTTQVSTIVIHTDERGRDEIESTDVVHVRYSPVEVIHAVPASQEEMRAFAEWAAIADDL